MPDSNFEKVASLEEIDDGHTISIEIGDDQVLVANVGGVIYATDDVCSHAYAMLSEGDLDGDQIECPLHGALFSLKTGEPSSPPASEPIRTFQVEIDGNDIYVGPEKD
ncbi:MAG TPA: Rieske (2Fe-2S) protein [Dehalococcoidia bacterium]|nr:Rieske (2Fe-2S) protein [Dehalococcoidia bacterium]|tara:strand:+ start:2142 stop:2465 length:324 start_codon:yes stop_codon:yes gene_type:complete